MMRNNLKVGLFAKSLYCYTATQKLARDAALLIRIPKSIGLPRDLFYYTADDSILHQDTTTCPVTGVNVKDGFYYLRLSRLDDASLKKILIKEKKDIQLLEENEDTLSEIASMLEWSIKRSEPVQLITRDSIEEYRNNRGRKYQDLLSELAVIPALAVLYFAGFKCISSEPTTKILVKDEKNDFPFLTLYMILTFVGLFSAFSYCHYKNNLFGFFRGPAPAEDQTLTEFICEQIQYMH